MSHISKRIRTANDIFRHQGIKGIISTIRDDKLGPFYRKSKLQLTVNNYWVGRLIELTGNKVRLDGCEFLLNSPAIPTILKSRVLFGKYEIPEREALRKYLDPQLPVIEFGGSIGVIACLTNKKISNPKQHIVIEANPDILPLLKANRDINKCQFTILHRAVAYGSDEITFHLGYDFLASNMKIPSNRSVNVPTISLRKIIDEYKFNRFTLICDIEGAEIELIKNEGDIFRERVQTLIIETHPGITGEKSVADTLMQISHMGFSVVFESEDTHVLEKY